MRIKNNKKNIIKSNLKQKIFNLSYHDVSTRKIPPVIDENVSTLTNQNDSLLNESNPIDLNRLNLNQETVPQQTYTNGKQHNYNNGTNGHTNGTFEADPLDTKQKSINNNNNNNKHTNNKATNGYSNGNHLNEDDDIDLAPQKSSSPLIKQGQSNGIANNSLRVNKVYISFN